MKPKLGLLLLLPLLLCLTACGGVSDLLQNQSPAPTATDIPILPTEVPESTEEVTIPQTLLIWVPPWLDPASETEAGQLLQTQLAAFSERHPGVRVDIRVKAETGDSGLYTSLSAASAAAPLALPDLIFLSREDMLSAASRELIFSMDEFLPGPLAEDWYEFSGELSQFNQTVYYLPAAIDAMVMAYRPTAIQHPPSSWAEVLDAPGILSFPAADPLAVFTIAQYLFQQPSLYDETQAYHLDQSRFEAIFNFYRSGQTSGHMPYWLTQYDSDEAAWQAFVEGRSHMTITWYTRYKNAETTSLLAAPIPTSTGSPYTLTTSWGWALANNDRSRSALAVELAFFLTEPEFLAEWNTAAGYLPPRADALALWPEGPAQALASQILPSGSVLPRQEDLAFLGQTISQAVIEVLKLETEPEPAALFVIEAVQP